MDCVLYEQEDSENSHEINLQNKKRNEAEQNQRGHQAYNGGDLDYRSVPADMSGGNMPSGQRVGHAHRGDPRFNRNNQMARKNYNENVDSSYREYEEGEMSQKHVGKLFIGGVSWETTEETLREHFEKYGALTDAALMKDKFSGQPRGFGFVTFADVTVLDRVLEESHTIDGRTVEVKRAIPRDKSNFGHSDARGSGMYGKGYSGGTVTESKKVFVGGLPPSVTEQDFRKYFEEFGKITDAVVMFDRETMRSRGFGFVTFEEESAVAEVISKSHEIHGKEVEIKRAEPKEVRGGGYGGRGGGYGGRGYGGGYNNWRGGYGGYGAYGGYGGRGGGGYAGYGGGYGYGGYPPGYGGYGNYSNLGGGRGGYGGGYGGYMGGYGGSAAYNAAGGGDGREGGNAGNNPRDSGNGDGDGYNKEPVGYNSSGGYGGGNFRQGGGGQMPPSRSERYRPY